MRQDSGIINTHVQHTVLNTNIHLDCISYRQIIKCALLNMDDPTCQIYLSTHRPSQLGKKNIIVYEKVPFVPIRIFLKKQLIVADSKSFIVAMINLDLVVCLFFLDTNQGMIFFFVFFLLFRVKTRLRSSYCPDTISSILIMCLLCFISQYRWYGVPAWMTLAHHIPPTKSFLLTNIPPANGDSVTDIAKHSPTPCHWCLNWVLLIAYCLP